MLGLKLNLLVKGALGRNILISTEHHLEADTGLLPKRVYSNLY